MCKASVELDCRSALVRTQEVKNVDLSLDVTVDIIPDGIRKLVRRCPSPCL